MVFLLFAISCSPSPDSALENGPDPVKTGEVAEGSAQGGVPRSALPGDGLAGEVNPARDHWWHRILARIRPEKSTVPAPEPDPGAVYPLLDDPLAQDAMRRIAEADQRYLDEPIFLPGLSGKDVRPRGARNFHARAWLVYDHDSGRVLLARRADRPYPVASITKLLSALILADTVPDLEEVLTILWEDKYFLMPTRSKLRIGGKYRAGDLLYQALLSSDNRAMTALMRQSHLPLEAFRDAMNRRARALGMKQAHFEEPTGLDPRDVCTARETVLLLEAALRRPLLREVLATPEHVYRRLDRPVSVTARATNRLMFRNRWDIIASKTGYTVMSGSCLVTRTLLEDGRTISIAILGARGVNGRYPVAEAIRAWLEAHGTPARLAGREASLPENSGG